MAFIEFFAMVAAAWYTFVSVRARHAKKPHMFITAAYTIFASPVGALTTSFWFSVPYQDSISVGTKGALALRLIMLIVVTIAFTILGHSTLVELYHEVVWGDRVAGFDGECVQVRVAHT